MTNPYLPPELLDYIADLLHDEPKTLKQCCLVSKSWVPRARRHLFADIKFRTTSDLESWKKTFPEAANSPAYHTRTLLVGSGCPELVTALDAEEGGWIPTFSGVASLDVDNGRQSLTVWDSLAPFHIFAPTIKSLRVRPVIFPSPQVFDLICSFPLLEDLNLRGCSSSPGHAGNYHGQRITIYSASPSFTGSLDLGIIGGVENVARQLLGLPDGLHFRKITFFWDRKEDCRWITELAASCSHTLESLDITHASRLGLEPALLDLSKAKKLRDVVFRPESKGVEWVTMTLQKITPEHRDLRRISVYVPHNFTLPDVSADLRQFLGDVAFGQWSDLDCLLVQFWESRSIRPRVECASLVGRGRKSEHCIGCLLPEITRRGIVDLG